MRRPFRSEVLLYCSASYLHSCASRYDPQNIRAYAVVAFVQLFRTLFIHCTWSSRIIGTDSYIATRYC